MSGLKKGLGRKRLAGLLFVANRFAHDSAFGLPALRFVASLRFRQNGSLGKQGVQLSCFDAMESVNGLKKEWLMEGI